MMRTSPTSTEQGQPRRLRRKGGFTLLEIVVSLAMLTIVVGALVSAHATVHQAQRQFRDSISASYVLQGVQTRHHLGIIASNHVPEVDHAWGITVVPQELGPETGGSVLYYVSAGKGNPPSSDASGFLTAYPEEN